MPRTIESSTITTLLPVEHFAHRVVLHLHLRVAPGLRRLNERAADVVIANQRELVGQPRFLGEAERGGVRGIGNAEHEIRAGGGALLREPPPKRAPRAIDRAAEHAAVGAREIHVLEHAAASSLRRSGMSERIPLPSTATISPGSTSRSTVAPTMSSAQVSDANTMRIAEPSHDERTPSARIARGEQRVADDDEQRVRAFDALQRIGELGFGRCQPKTWRGGGRAPRSPSST